MAWYMAHYVWQITDFAIELFGFTSTGSCKIQYYNLKTSAKKQNKTKATQAVIIRDVRGHEINLYVG